MIRRQPTPQLARWLVVLVWALLAAGCGTLPPREAMQPSQAFADTQHTRLGRVATASLAGETRAGRSAIFNTELGVTIDCAPLALQALSLLRADAFASMYRLRLAGDGHTLEWHARGSGDTAVVERSEPHASPWLDLSLWLQSLFVAEESL